MKFRKQQGKAPVPSHSESFYDSAAFGGSPKCLHVWREPLGNSLIYDGVVPAGFNRWEASPFGTRCLACGRVTLYVSMSRTLPE